MINEKTLLSPKIIYEELNNRVAGQHEAKKAAAIAVFLHIVNFLHFKLEGKKTKKSGNLLLLGPTGCGKTYIIKQACAIIKDMLNYQICPMLEIDCTHITATGWQGDDIQEEIENHFKKNRTCEPESSIIFLDEFDKLCMPAMSTGGTDHNKLTQQSLLKLIEGMRLERMSDNYMEYSTEQCLFVLAGSFQHLRDNIESKKKKQENAIGFVRPKSHADEVDDIHELLINNGMIPELAGRISDIAVLQPLTNEDMHKIMDIQVIPEIEYTFGLLDLELELTEEQKQTIIDICVKRKLGARGLYTEMRRHVQDTLFNAELKL